MVMSAFAIWIIPPALWMVEIVVFIVQFIVMNCAFWAKKIREITRLSAVNANAKREMIVYHHQIMHNILLVLDLDNNLMSKAFLLLLTFQV